VILKRKEIIAIMDTTENPIIEFVNVSKQNGLGRSAIYPLHNVSFRVEKGEFCIIEGKTGAGMTTLIDLLTGTDKVTDGKIFFNGQELSAMNKKQIGMYQRNDVGFIFKFYTLVPLLTVKENIEIASHLRNGILSCRDIIEMVGLGDKAKMTVSELTVEEEQRLVIARALAKNAKLILCDDPMSLLDYETGKEILKLLYDICKKNNSTIIFVTENNALSPIADRVITIKSGEVLSEIVDNEPLSIDEIEW
jgi:putative ABC transport system ATP-binding protein